MSLRSAVLVAVPTSVPSGLAAFPTAQRYLECQASRENLCA